MAERCTIHSLPVATLDEAAQSPSLAALLAEGWEPIATVMVSSGPPNDGPVLKIMLRPPRPMIVVPDRRQSLISAAVTGAVTGVIAAAAAAGVVYAW